MSPPTTKLTGRLSSGLGAVEKAPTWLSAERSRARERPPEKIARYQYRVPAWRPSRRAVAVRSLASVAALPSVVRARASVGSVPQTTLSSAGSLARAQTIADVA